jgi:5-methylcytosine-specific restriction endonuclease McrA
MKASLKHKVKSDVKNKVSGDGSVATKKASLKKAPLKNEVLENDLENDTDSVSASKLKRTRYVPVKVRRHVWQRAGGSCEHADPTTGNRCGARYMLEIDHEKPFALGGAHTTENLRLYCRAHNQARIEKGKSTFWIMEAQA